MGVFKYRPKYPAIHQSPPFGLIFRNFNAADWSIVGLTTALGFPIGFYAGNINRVTRSPLMWYTAAVGAAGGWTAAMLRSGGRLLGYQPNEGEVAQYKYRLDYTDYQVRVEPLRTITNDELQDIADNPRY